MPHTLLLEIVKNDQPQENQQQLDTARAILEQASKDGNDTRLAILNTDYGFEAGLLEEQITGMPLPIAVFNNNLPMVKLLLQYGANPSLKDAHERDVLRIALDTLPIETDQIEDKINIIDLLCLHGATLAENELSYQLRNIEEWLEHPNLNVRAFKKSILERVLFESFYIDLIQFIAENDSEKTKSLLEQSRLLTPFGGQVFLCDLGVINHPHHPYYNLHVLEAARLKDSNILKYLHEVQHVSLIIGDKNGNTPLHYAAQFGSCETIQYLLEKGADREALNHMHQIPLALCDNASKRLLMIRYWPASGLAPHAQEEASPKTVCRNQLDRFLPTHYRPTSPLLWRDEPHMIPDSDSSDDERSDDTPVKRPRVA